MATLRAFRIIFSVLLFVPVSTQVNAQAWTLLSDFETATLGDPDGQESWTNISGNADSYAVVVDPDDESNRIRL